MKCRVIKGFIDKMTDTPYDAGKIYECDNKRFAEIQSKGNYLVVLDEKAAVKPNNKPEKTLKK